MASFSADTFFQQVSELAGLPVRLNWSAPFVFDSHGVCCVYHCEVIINGQVARTNIKPSSNPQDWADEITVYMTHNF